MRNAAIQFVDSLNTRKNLVDFRSGDTVRVWWKVKEGEKERSQAFEDVIIRKTNGSVDATFTVRKMSFNVDVKRIFPLHSPRYESLEVLSRGDVRRGRLFYLRGLRGKAARLEALEENTPAASAATPAAK